MKDKSPPFENVAETINGEIKVYEILPSGLSVEITDLDRLEKLLNDEYQIAEHKSTQKLSLLEPALLNEMIQHFCQQNSVTIDIYLNPKFERFEVYDAIEDSLPAQERQKKARGKLTKLDRARRKYVQSLVNKAKAIHLIHKEGDAGRASVQLDVNPLGGYTGPVTESEPDILKSMIADIKRIVFRFVDEALNELIPISEHTEQTMVLLIALAQSEIDETYHSLEIDVKFERQVK
ncbi:MAG: hypothetical protein AAF639_16565 [Chloroflexota bacterium]